MTRISPGFSDRVHRWLCAFLLAHCLILAAAYAQHPTHAPRRQSSSSRLRALLDPIMQKAVADGSIPGAALLVGHNGHVVYRRAFGNRSLEPAREPMTLDTI